MHTKTMLKVAVIAAGLLLVMSVARSAGAWNTPTSAAIEPIAVSADDKCANVSAAQTADAAYQKIAKKYPDEAKHLNVHVENGVASVRGWVSSEKIKKNVLKIVKKTKCITTVNDFVVIGKGGGCGANEQQCGGTCIPKTERCNIRG